MDSKNIAVDIVDYLDREAILVDEDGKVALLNKASHGPTDLLLLSDADGRGLGKYRVVVEPVDPGIPMDFPAALRAAKSGAWIARAGWNGKGMHVRLMVVFGLLPFLALHTAQDDLVPWTASQTDLLAEDWVMVPPARAVAADAQAGKETT